MAKRTRPITIQAGRLTGLYDKEGRIAVFKGIPFAHPPLGDLRWKPPQPVVPWTGTLKAEKAGAMAIQLGTDFKIFIDLFAEGQGWGVLKTAAVRLLLKLPLAPKQSEDCLTLNVRTPALDKGAKLPVMVWIHGGDHQDGSANDIIYNSNTLAERGVVVVYIQYRLGLMGYFSHPELSLESGQGVSGNYGTLDQIAALRWVQENIGAFGGDPDRVTIFGESAGGESVAHMMTSPLAQGLFQQAIMQSPANSGQMTFLRQPFLNNPAGEAFGKAFADSFVPGDGNQLATLHQISAEKLYALCRQERKFQHFYPLIDGAVLEKSPFEAFLDGDQVRVPLLLGSNADEGTLIYPLGRSPVREHRNEDIQPDQVAPLIRDEFGEEGEMLLDLYPGLRQGEETAQMAFLGDSMFGSAVHFYALNAAKAGQPVYLYHFSRRPPATRPTAGAHHGAEIPFVHGRALPLSAFSEADEALREVMIDYWTQFAKSGNPNNSPHPEWPAFTARAQQEMVLGTGDDLGATEVPRLAQYELIQSRLRRQIEAMKRLRQGALEVMPA